jgi:hypothetical protein
MDERRRAGVDQSSYRQVMAANTAQSGTVDARKIRIISNAETAELDNAGLF